MRKMYANRKEQFPLPEFHTPEAKVVVSLTSYKHRLKDIIPTLVSLHEQSYKPDLVVLYVADEDLPLVTDEIREYCEVRGCEDTKSYKKFNGIFDFPDCYVVTADDDLIYHEDWLKTLLRASQLAPNCVAAHNTFILSNWNWGGVATRMANRRSIQGMMHMYVMTGAGVLIPPGVAGRLEELHDAHKFNPYCDEKALTALLYVKHIPVVATSMNSDPYHHEAYRNSVSLWDMYNCKNQELRWNETKKWLQSHKLL